MYLKWWFKGMFSTNDELRIYNDELCIKHDGLFIKHDELCILEWLITY